MKKLVVIGISVVLMITLTAGVLAEDLLGREVVEKGETTTLSGTLAYDDGEWYLESGEELVQIHLGNQAYLDSIGLELTAGEEASVYGFLAENNIAPITITLGADAYRLRDESGFPLWAGAGERRNADNGEGRGMGRNQGDGRSDVGSLGQGLGQGRGQGARGQGAGAFGTPMGNRDCSAEG
jgi:hypothetical protein